MGTRMINSFMDVLNLPNDDRVRMRIRSMVGLIPLFAVETLEPELLEKLPGFQKAAGMVFEPPAGSRAPGILIGSRRAAASGGCCRCCAGHRMKKTAAAHAG